MRSPREAKELLQSLSDREWLQKFEIAPGVFTAGRHDVKLACDRCQIPRDLRGKTVLDIGAFNGGFSFEMEARGAKRVVAMDVVPEDYFGLGSVADFLGSKVEYIQGNVYDLDPKEVGTFDIVLFLAVLYHCRHPMLALDRVWAVTDGVCYVESHIIDGNLVTPWGKSVSLDELHPRLKEIPIVRFHRLAELEKDPTNWFSPNIAGLEAWLWSTGFKPTLVATWPEGHPVRAAFHAYKVHRPPEWFRVGAYEAYAPSKLLGGFPSEWRPGQDSETLRTGAA